METQGEIAVEEAQKNAHHRWEVQEIDRLEARRNVENRLTPERVQEQLIEILPSLASALPTAQELQRIHISSDGGPDGLSSLIGLLASLKQILASTNESAARANESLEE